PPRREKSRPRAAAWKVRADYLLVRASAMRSSLTLIPRPHVREGVTRKRALRLPGGVSCAHRVERPAGAAAGAAALAEAAAGPRRRPAGGAAAGAGPARAHPLRRRAPGRRQAGGEDLPLPGADLPALPGARDAAREGLRPGRLVERRHARPGRPRAHRGGPGRDRRQDRGRPGGLAGAARRAVPRQPGPQRPRPGPLPRAAARLPAARALRRASDLVPPVALRPGGRRRPGRAAQDAPDRARQAKAGLTMPPPTALVPVPRLTQARLRVFFCLCALADRGPVSKRDLLRLTGGRSTNALEQKLRSLERLGLVAREPHRARTLRPLFRIEIWS